MGRMFKQHWLQNEHLICTWCMTLVREEVALKAEVEYDLKDADNLVQHQTAAGG